MHRTDVLMEEPLKIVYSNILPAHKEALDSIIREHAVKLDKYFPKIVNCRIVVERPQGRHHVGDLYRTTITLTVPHKQIVVNRKHPRNHSHEDMFVTVGHAFDDAARQLEEYARVLHKELKDHDLLPHGVIHKLYLKDGYGFIQTYGGKEIYFHRNSVIDGFDNLEIGTEVRFEEEEGEKGPQASTVKIVRKEHAHHRH